MAPNANAYAESWIASIRRECVGHFWCFGLGHLDRLVKTYVDYYNRHRPHQGLGNRALQESATQLRLTIEPSQESVGSIACRSELGGILKHYYRCAA